jgi:hypothetical protein
VRIRTESFRHTHDERPVPVHASSDVGEQLGAIGWREIDGHITAQDDVKSAERCGRLKQIVASEGR